MAKFSYIDTDGNQQTHEAASPVEALATAPNIAKDSGVQLLNGVPSPYAAPAKTDTPSDLTARMNAQSSSAAPKSTGRTYEAGGYMYDEASGKVIGTAKPDEQAIRDAENSRVQSIVNAINAKYATVEAQDNQTVDLMDRERRAANTMRGLAGSDAGTAKTIETAQKGAQIKSLTAQQKGAEIQAALQGGIDRASAEFKAQKEAYIKSSKDALTAEQTLNEKIKNDAVKEIANLAGTASWEEILKHDPNFVARYSQETGLDETSLKALFLKETEANWDKIKEVSSPGKETFIYKNKATGEIKTEDIATPEGYKFVSSVGNDGAFINESTRDIQYINGPKSTSGGTKITDGSLQTSQSEIGQGAKLLLEGASIGGQKFNGTGTDGYADPYLYKAIYEDWRAKGGTPQGFVKYYPPAKYVNPAANSILPAVLQVKTTKTSAGGGA